MIWQSTGCGVTGPGALPMSGSCKLGDPGRVSHSSELTLAAVRRRAQHLLSGEAVPVIDDNIRVKRVSPSVAFWRVGNGTRELPGCFPAGYSGDDMFRETTFLRSGKCNRQLAHYGLQGCKLACLRAPGKWNKGGLDT